MQEKQKQETLDFYFSQDWTTFRKPIFLPRTTGKAAKIHYLFWDTQELPRQPGSEAPISQRKEFMEVCLTFCMLVFPSGYSPALKWCGVRCWRGLQKYKQKAKKHKEAKESFNTVFQGWEDNYWGYHLARAWGSNQDLQVQKLGEKAGRERYACTLHMLSRQRIWWFLSQKKGVRLKCWAGRDYLSLVLRTFVVLGNDFWRSGLTKAKINTQGLQGLQTSSVSDHTKMIYLCPMEDKINPQRRQAGSTIHYMNKWPAFNQKLPGIPRSRTKSQIKH